MRAFDITQLAYREFSLQSLNVTQDLFIGKIERGFG